VFRFAVGYGPCYNLVALTRKAFSQTLCRGHKRRYAL
jgi:hypothetical protein